MRGSLLVFAYVAAVVLPGLLLLFGSPAAAGFLLHASGLIGLASLMMLCAQFVTSGRFEQLAAPFGLDVIMGFHRFAGRVIILTVSAHVLLSVWLAAARDPREVPAALIALMASNRLATGFVALVMLLLLVWSATHRDRIGVRYEWWRLSHGVGAFILVCVAAHHAWMNALFLRTGDVAIAIVGGLAAALASLVVIYLVRPMKARSAKWTVKGIRPLGVGLHELTLSSARLPAFDFKAGQFVWVTFGRHHPVTDHPFSIASAPDELPQLRLVIKENGDFTDAIGTLPIGTSAHLDGPHGNFVAHPDAASIVLIAGGVGIAPILSILRALDCSGYTAPVALLVAMRDEPDPVLTREIGRSSQNLDMRIMLVVERPSELWKGECGRIDEPKLRRLLSNIPVDRAQFLMCGPAPMMERTSELLLDFGVSADQFKYERFDYQLSSDVKGRTVRHRFYALLGTTMALVLVFAAAGAYLS